VLDGSSVTFTWTPGTPGATEFALWLGNDGPGSSDFYSSGVTTATSVTATGLPTKGTTVYARLFSNAGGGWSHTDYTFTEGTAVLATMISPAQGATVGAPSVTFSWTPGLGISNYALWLGTAVGSSDLYSSGDTSATTVTVTGLPENGGTLYARLFSETGGVYQSHDYTFVLATAGPATMISPTAGSTLGTSGVMFTWTTGTGVTQYNLWLGLSGPGSSDLYASGWTASTSVTVPRLPANGAKVYARLFSEGSGGIQHVDYTYTAQ
jgi:hypothetical protein